jgi:hypothetical protein
MAAPNIVNVATITGKTNNDALTTVAAAIVNNPASSGKVFKVNSLYVANIDGTNSADVTINYYTQDDIGGTARAIASTIPVPADSTLVVVSKDAPLYLEEDKSLGGLASANGDLVYVVSYEEIS